MIHIFWDVTLHYWVSGSQHLEESWRFQLQKSSLNLKMKAPWSSEHQKLLTQQHGITTQKT